MRDLDQLVYFGRLSGMEPDAARSAAEKWVERLGVADRGGDLVDELSLGNQQRVQLAAALVHSPEALILDEPFSGLDPVGVDVLSSVLRDEVARGVALVFSSHQLDLVESLCDTVTIIDKGRGVASGAIDRLRAERAGRRVRVALENGVADWASGIRGATVVSVDGGAVVLDLAGGADPDGVLDTARAAGRLTHFSHVTPTLAELFREVVAP